MSKTAIVTGGSSGIGLETAKKLAEMGFRVYALSRHPKAYPTFVSLECDVTDEKAVKHVEKKIALETGHIDLLINAAGFGISGAVEFTDTEDAKRLFDTNCGFKPNTFTYPYGFHSDTAEQVIRELGFEASLGVEEKPNYIVKGDSDCLFGLNRYNRSGLTDTESFMNNMLSDFKTVDPKA